MDLFNEANHELDRLQGIIARHEEHIFKLRGWLLTVLGGVLAGYYTGNLDLSIVVIRYALPVITLLFLVMESRHANVVEAVVDRARRVEKEVRSARRRPQINQPWYQGPQVSAACARGAKRILPRAGMTFRMNAPFYVVLLVVVIAVALLLPPRH